MSDPHQHPPTLTLSEQVLVHTFENWREEFRAILEDHRREIQDRLEKIEREIEKKSDKETVDLMVRSIREELLRHANEIHLLHTRVSTKVGVETMWKLGAMTLAVGSAFGGLIGFLIHLLLELRP